MMHVINPLYEIEIKIKKYEARINCPEHYTAFVPNPEYGSVSAQGKDIQKCLKELGKILDGAERFRKATEDKPILPANSSELFHPGSSLNYQYKGGGLAPVITTTGTNTKTDSSVTKAIDYWENFSKKFQNYLKNLQDDAPFEGDGYPAY